MDQQQAKEMLETLANGVNPVTGEVLPPEDSCSQAEVVWALHTAIAALTKPEKPVKAPPKNAGAAWRDDEVQQLLQEHEAGMTATQIGKLHGRSRGAIQSKLASLGLMDDPYFMRRPKRK